MFRKSLIPTVFFLLAAVSASAQMPLHPPEIRTVFPIGGVQGSVVEVLVEGQNVANPLAVAITGEGVQASVVKRGEVPETRIVGPATTRVRFEIAPDAPLGIREFRLLTPAGLTSRGLFEISRGMASLQESEPNNTFAAAPKVALPVTV